MATQYKVLVNTGTSETEKALDIVQGAGDKGLPVPIKAQPGARYQMQEVVRDKVTAPDTMRVRRKGKDLQILFEGSGNPDLIIENYYDEMSAGYNGVVGEAENGNLYEYIPEDPNPEGLIPDLADDGKTVNVALGGTKIAAVDAIPMMSFAAPSAAPSAVLSAAGVGAAGVGAAAINSASGKSDQPVKPTMPAAPSSYADDVGSIASGNSTASTTDDTAPGINIGTVPAGATPSLYVDGIKVPATYDATTGTLTPDTALSEGLHQITYTLTDTAGKESVQSPALTLTVDTTAPTTPNSAPGSYADDVGSVQGATSTAATTDDTTPGINIGAVPTAATPSLYVDGIKVSATYDATSGTLTPTTPLGEGAYQITYTLTDPAGNESAKSPELNLTIDVTALGMPSAPTSYADNVGSVQDATSTAATTDDTTPGINIGAGLTDTPSLYVDGTKVEATYDSASGTLTPTSALPEGAHQITYTLTDPAGNESAPSGALQITVDTTAPGKDVNGSPATIPAPTVIIAEATNGVSSAEAADGVQTSVTLPTGTVAGDVIQLTITDPSGDVRTVSYAVTQDDVTKGSAAVTIPTSALSEDGTYGVSATVTDAVGNSSTAGTTNFTLDRTAPTQVVTIAGVVDDQGPITNDVTGGTIDDTSPGLKGALSAALAFGEVVHIYDGATYLGAAVINGTSWTFQDARTLANGAQVSYTAQVVDAAGNTGAVSAAVNIAISTSVPTVTITSVAGDAVADAGNGTYDAVDRGSDPTKVTTKFAVSGSATNLDGKTLSVTINNKNYSALVTGGKWTAQLNDADSVALNHGNTYNIVVSGVSDNGKIATDTNNGAVINIAAPDIPTVLNNYSGTITPTLSGSAMKEVPGTPVTYIALATGDILSIKVGGATYTGTLDTTQSNNGLPTGLSYDTSTQQWSLNTATATPSSSTLTLASGNTYDVIVSVTAGGVTKTDISSGELVINTVAPTITLTPIAGDNTINAAEASHEITVSGTTTAQVGSIITLTGLDNSSYTATVLAGTNGNNTFSIVLSATEVAGFATSDGSKTAALSVTNQYGLVGTANQLVTIDVTAPTTPAAPSSYADDVGSVQGATSTASTTDDTTPGINIGTVPAGTTPSLYVDGIKVSATYNSTTGTLTPDTPLADGTHSITYTLTDPAGNQSAPSGALNVTIDTQAPAKPSAPLSYKDDQGTITGNSRTAETTDDTKPGINIGTVPAGTTPSLYVDGTKVPATYDATTGTLTPTTPLAEGPHAITYTLTDPAGNESDQSTALNLTIDVTAPTAPTSAPSSYVDNAGSLISGNSTASTTDDTTPGINIGTVPAGTTPSLYVDGTKVPANYDATSGTLTPTTPLAEGLHAITYTLTDPAGNESAQSPALNLTIDLTAPSTPAAPSSYVDNVGSVQGATSTAATTDDTTPGINVGKGLTDTPSLYVDGTKVSATYDATTGMLTPTTPLAGGPHAITYTLTDPAGNESSQSPALSLTVDTTAPTQIAQYTSMTKDSSSSTANADWTTADSSAGRLVSGTLSAPLAADEQLAVYGNDSLIGYGTLNAARNAWVITDNNGYSSSWTYTAKVIDAAGNAGAVQSQVVNADTIVAAPVITNVKDIAAASIATGGSTTNMVKTVIGTAEKNATVYLYDSTNANLVATTTADASGNWTATIASPTAGTHTFAAVQIDTVGNESVYSNLWTVARSDGVNQLTNGNFDTDTGTTAPTLTKGGFTAPGVTWQEAYTGVSTLNNAAIQLVTSVDPPTTINIDVATTTSASGTTSGISWSKQYVSSSSVYNPDGELVGNILAVNIAENKKITFWNSSVTVEAGKVYQFMLDYSTNISLAGSLGMNIDGVALTIASSSQAAERQAGHYHATFTANATKTVTLELWGINSNVSDLNQFGDVFVDNLSFAVAAPTNNSTLAAGANTDSATSNADALTYTGGVLDTLGGGDTITASSTSLQSQLANGGRITGGAGVDTLKLAAGTALDLEALTNNQTVKPIQGVEVFTLQGTSALTLSANDVLSLGGANTGSTSAGNTSTMAMYSFTSTTQTADGSLAATGSTSSAGKVQFVINGTSNDQVNLDALLPDGVTGQNSVVGNTGLSGQWDYKGIVTLTGVDGLAHTYKVYNHSTTSAQVLVDSVANVTIRPAAVAPIVLDLNGDGTLSYTQQLMDVNTDGLLDYSAWAAREDGVLVWDKFDNGLVTDANQYAFTSYGGTTDLEGLRAGFDSNADGVLNVADAKFAEFGVWQDMNGNGLSEAGEFISLADLGVKSINLTSDGVLSTPATGVSEAGRTTVEMIDGSTRVAADAAFTFQTLPELNLDGVLHNNVGQYVEVLIDQHLHVIV